MTPSGSPQARTALGWVRAERARPLETAEGSGEGGSRLQEHSPLGHYPPVPSSPRPQFLRDSLKMTRGSSWSLRLSKELSNQIQSFDSPSLEKVGSQRQGRADREGTPGTAHGRPGRPEAAQAPWAGRRLAGPDPRAVVFVLSCFPSRTCFVGAGGHFPSSHQLPHSSHLTPTCSVSPSRVHGKE